MNEDFIVAATKLRAAASLMAEAADALDRASSQNEPGDLPTEVRAIIERDGVHPLVAWRRHRFVSQESLAERAGIRAGTILDIEHRRRQPKPGTLLKLAEALRCEPSQLVP